MLVFSALSWGQQEGIVETFQGVWGPGTQLHRDFL